MSAFEELGVCPELIRACDEQGWALPTPVQAEAVPLILGGGDVMVGACEQCTRRADLLRVWGSHSSLTRCFLAQLRRRAAARRPRSRCRCFRLCTRPSERRRASVQLAQLLVHTPRPRTCACPARTATRWWPSRPTGCCARCARLRGCVGSGGW